MFLFDAHLKTEKQKLLNESHKLHFLRKGEKCQEMLIAQTVVWKAIFTEFPQFIYPLNFILN